MNTSRDSIVNRSILVDNNARHRVIVKKRVRFDVPDNRTEKLRQVEERIKRYVPRLQKWNRDLKRAIHEYRKMRIKILKRDLEDALNQLHMSKTLYNDAMSQYQHKCDNYKQEIESCKIPEGLKEMIGKDSY